VAFNLAKMDNDSVREVGVKNRWHYYNIYRKSSIGHKLDLPYIVKINESRKCVSVGNLKKNMWAVHQIVIMNNLRHVFQHISIENKVIDIQ
jgi:hypothetical protein